MHINAKLAILSRLWTLVLKKLRPNLGLSPQRFIYRLSRIWVFFWRRFNWAGHISPRPNDDKESSIPSPVDPVSFVPPGVHRWTICPSLQPSDQLAQGSSLTSHPPQPNTSGAVNDARSSSHPPTLHSTRHNRKYTQLYEFPVATSSKDSVNERSTSMTDEPGDDSNHDISRKANVSGHSHGLSTKKPLQEGQPDVKVAPAAVSPVSSVPHLAVPGEEVVTVLMHAQQAQGYVVDPHVRPASAASSYSRMSRSSVRSRASYRKYNGPMPPSSLSSGMRPTFAAHSMPQLATGSSHALAFPPGHLTALPTINNEPGQETFLIDYDYTQVLPMSTLGVLRYDKKEVISTDKSAHIIPALTVEYPVHDDSELLRNGWTVPFHPEGAFYFLNEKRRIFTEADIRDPDIFTDISGFADYLQSELRRLIDIHKLPLNFQEVELVIEPQQGDNYEIVGRYYFVDSRNQYLFWLTDYDATPILHNCRGVELMAHKRFAVHAEYWRHWELFPNLCHLSQDILDYLKELMLQARCVADEDHLTSHQSAAPYDADQLEKLYSVIGEIKISSHSVSPLKCEHSVWIVGRMMYEFARNQFINFHGLQGSRLNFEQSIHDQKFTRSTLMSILSPMFFYTPDVHRTALHKIFVDNIASSFTWNKFVDKVNSELQEQNLLATVLLNANVGFLAIQTVDNGSNIGTNNDVTRSPIQVASYLSLVASAGSIILGLVLLRHNRTKARETADEAAKFLSNMGHKKYGQEALALIYSLPYALLMWGMLLFLAAFLTECYYPRALAPSLIVGVASLAVFALTSGCIYALNTEQNGRQKWWLKKILAVEQTEHASSSSMTNLSMVNGSEIGVRSSLWSRFLKMCTVSNAQTRQEPEAVVELQRANSAQGPPAIILRQATLRPDNDNSANGPSQV